tara:strand:- start:4516 stop:5487 length:972 start_codon:yes stop_codon:yes gene_type:complete
MVSSASSAYVIRSYETSFKSGGTVEHSFGFDTKMSGLEWSNNQSTLPQLYTPEVEAFLYGKNSGSCSIEYTLGNSYFLTGLFHDPVTQDNTTNNTQVKRIWKSDPTLNSNIRTVKSQHLEFGAALTGQNVVRNAKGVVVETVNLKTSIDNPVSVTETFVWGKEDAISTGLDSTIPNNASFTAMNFVHSSVEMPNGTTLTKVQDLDLTINRNQKLLYALGSADAQAGYPQLLEMTGKVTMAFENPTILNAVIARGELASFEITITNGLTNADQRSLTLLFSGIGLSKHGTPTVSPGDLITQEFDFTCRSVVATAVDATAIFNWT